MVGTDESGRVQRSGAEQVVRTDLLDGVGIDDRRLHVSDNRDHGNSLVERVDQAVEKMRGTGSGGAAHDDRLTGQIGLTRRRQGAIFFIPNVNELHLAIGAQGIHDGVQSITDNAVASANSSLD